MAERFESMDVIVPMKCFRGIKHRSFLSKSLDHHRPRSMLVYLVILLLQKKNNKFNQFINIDKGKTISMMNEKKQQIVSFKQ